MALLPAGGPQRSPQGYGNVRAITIRLCVIDCTGMVYFTDVMFQAGSIATGWSWSCKRNPVDT